MKAALVFDRYAVWAQTTDVVLLRSRSLGPSLAATAVVCHLRINSNFRSM